MKKLFFCFSILLFFNCSEKSKKSESPLKQNEANSPTILEENKKKDNYANQIIPGKRLGSIILNQNATAVLDSLGKPDSGDAAMGKAISTWKKGDNLLTLYTTTQAGIENFSRIKAVRSLSKDFKTVDNLGVNSSLAKLKRYYKLNPVGKFTYNGKHYFLYTTEKGIAFEVGLNEKCKGVLVYLQDTNLENFYLPIYPDFKKL
ncbi:MAG: hypothetical protein Q8O62_03425 [Aequorivita sp.]|nr:hypothetical protein [Aequorivita sp.]